MKILHVASFHGNIGDNANHTGFRPWFEHIVGRHVEWREFEIRKVYRKELAFDEAFVEAANASDLVVVGGGNYFELWVEKSPSGTSISLSEDLLKQIHTPIFFNALGVDDGQGAPQENLSKFRAFLSLLLASQQYHVSVRNDGAFTTLQKYFGDLPLDLVSRLPDGGFFSMYGSWDPQYRGPFKVGINLAGDMLGVRFPGNNNAHTYTSFLEEMSQFLARVALQRSDAILVFFPHIFRDLKIYSDLLDLLPDDVRREQVVVESYGAGMVAARRAFESYVSCRAVLGMRFHANVVPIGCGVPTIGLGCYAQVQKLYSELEMPGGVVDVTRLGFSDELSYRLDTLLARPDMAADKTLSINIALERVRNSAGHKLARWLSSVGLK